jgi:hypothetical protein
MLGFVFQSFNLIDDLTIEENVALGLAYRRPAWPRAREGAGGDGPVGIAHRARHFPHQLSGGQQQRAAIARAIVGDPKLILADEPTGNLDTENGAQVMDILTALNQAGATIVMVTHSQPCRSGPAADRHARRADRRLGRPRDLRGAAMNRFALLALYRSLTRHKLYAALNIGGLAVGIAVFLVLGLYVRFQTSFETWVPHHEQIEVVQTVWHIPNSPFNGPSSYTMGGLLEELRQDFPGVTGTRINGGEGAGTVIRGGIATTEDVAQVDGNFFDVFDLPMVSGSGKALLVPTNTLVSRSFARRYFGDSNPIGQTLTVATGNDLPTDFRIAGVFEDLPKNSDLRLSVLIQLPISGLVHTDFWHHWGSTSLNTYLRFASPQAAHVFEAKLPAFVNRRALHDLGPDPWKTQSLGLLPLTSMHLTPQGQDSASAWLTVVALGVVGTLTLLIAIVNYVNLATARAGCAPVKWRCARYWAPTVPA